MCVFRVCVLLYVHHRVPQHPLPPGHHVIGTAPVLGLLCSVVCGKEIVLFKAKKEKKK